MRQHMLYFIGILFIIVCYTYAGCNKKIRMYRGYGASNAIRRRMYRKTEAKQQIIKSIVASEDKTTTLSPKVQMVLNQLSDSKIIRNKSNYKALLQELKNIFHTKVPKSITQKCSKCKET